MVWSVSTAKIFDRCQRQWFYKQHFANARSKDETRRKAYLLGKLRSVSGWRGSLVDQVLSFEIIPCPYRKSDSAIMVMKSAEDGRRYDAAHVLDGAMERSVFVERPMCPQLVVIGGILRQNPA